LGEQRLTYPRNHIEADNRLSWLLGRLDERYGDEAFYVHLIRKREETSASFSKRREGIIKAYMEAIVPYSKAGSATTDVCDDYYETVNGNIRLFLKDKSKTMCFRLEYAKDDFRRFWDLIEAEGDLDAALQEFDVLHNASAKPRKQMVTRALPVRFIAKIKRVARAFPEFLRRA
jgi:hypothetical protein